MTYQLNLSLKKLDKTIEDPIVAFNKFRTIYKNSVLFEANDTKKKQHISYICFDPIASLKIQDKTVIKKFPNREAEETLLEKEDNVVNCIKDFAASFKVGKHEHDFINNGLFGYMSYDAVRYFETIELTKKDGLNIPDIFYNVYKNIIVIDHLKKETYLLIYSEDYIVDFSLIETILQYRTEARVSFKKVGDVQSNVADEDFKEMVAKAKEHCLRGDVFQLVLSKRFMQKFEGDELKVYKVLKEINPSPYMFFYDHHDFKIFGCSPEAQLIVENNIAEIHPIAGTYRRSGSDEKDRELANKLYNDAKENAEHVMLVDLARNDLSRNAKDVNVEIYKEIQYFSHVIHLVSKVTGKKNDEINTLQLVADTFPAGTLSGAPKYKAMELIEKYEPNNRDFYGGAIGYIDFEGNFNHAIMIRTFLSKDQHLNWQAGAGIVISSSEESELNEVYNKSGALVKALEYANEV
ncbi:anthranilate synthase component I family protein [Pseudofulvibacter geojedonensis]|uniref:Anthranilate synthase component 1 n=1 Tax=Pseudofulvibacter geojedonensis TaxID=1123758 RepID=A0ABW3HZX5_9FLAO